MRTFKECNPLPKSAPSLDKCEKSKSKKVIKLQDEWFFIAEAGRGTTVYSIRLEVQLAYFPYQDRDKIFKWLLKKLPIIKGLDNEF